jgi:hypothetical protein
MGGDDEHLMSALRQGSRDHSAQRADALGLRIEVVAPELDPHGQGLYGRSG